MTVPTFTTFNGLARRTGFAPATLFRRIRELGIEPDAITVETGRPSVLLFATEKLPAIRRTLANQRTIPT